VRRIVLAALCGVAALSLPASPASAYCSPVMYYLTGICNPCYATASVWSAADRATGGDLLGPMYCLD
jgi:hypothetical protein